MPVPIPPSRPQLKRDELLEALAPLGIDRKVSPIVVVGIRGYYRDTLGKPGTNDRAIYDDAIIIDAPEAYVTFNANTDPSAYRLGAGKGVGKGMASLKSGVWRAHQFGDHKGKYLALIQTGGAVTVTRDGSPPYDDTGYFGINIHKGGANTTSSEGCQTLPPAQWDSFIATVVDQAKRQFGASWRKAVIPYVLLDGAP
jgi:hypothetical protein